MKYIEYIVEEFGVRSVSVFCVMNSVAFNNIAASTSEKTLLY